MVTIHNLEVRFEVEDGDDDAVFARLFEKYIRQWNRKQEEMKEHERWMVRERALGDRKEEPQQ
jgi:hypothetical protein